MSHSPLKVFTDRAYLPEELKHCLMLIPFWGDHHAHDGFARLEREGKEFVQLVAPEDAEVALLPFDGSHLLKFRGGPNPRAVELAAQFVERARTAGLRTIIMVNSDSTAAIPLPDVIVFRTSLNRRTHAPMSSRCPPGTKTWW